MNIIIKTPNFIGDTIMTLSAFELLKQEYPNAIFTIVCPATSVDVFRGKGINRFIIDYGKKKRLKNSLKMVKEIKKESYDLGILFHNTFLDALIFKLSTIKRIIGYNKEGRKILLDFWLKIDRNRHYINHYANLVNQYLENKFSNLPKIELHTEPSTMLKKSEKPMVGFVLGGENKGTRRYPQKLSLKLFELIKNEDYQIVLIGDEHDNINNQKYEDYLKKEQNDVLNLSGKTNIAEFIDLVASLDLLVTIDSSAMHIAATTETPFIVLLGKGTSAFDTVYPKVDFGHILFEGKDKIRDEDIIQEIKPQSIANTIKEVLNKL